jgi:uncharacterized protein involved in outer membrane biogenesis
VKGWKKVVSAVVVLAVATVVAGIAVLKSLDFNQYRGLLADQVKAVTGRELKITGTLKLEISLNPALAVADVSFANASWGSRPQMATLKQLAAEVELMPLLTGDVRVRRLVLTGVDLLLETDAKGRGNWELAVADKKPEKADKAPDAAGRLPIVHSVRLKDLTAAYRDGRTGTKTTLKLARLDAGAAGLDSPVTVALAGDFDGKAFEASGKLGSVATLMKSGTAYPVSLRAKALGADVSIEGAVAEPRTMRGFDFKVSLDAKDPGPLAKALGVDLAKAPPVKFAATLNSPAKSPDAYVLDNLTASIGGSDLFGRVMLRLPAGGRPTVEARLGSALLDVDALTDALPKKPATPKAAGKKPSRVFPADPLSLDGLKAADARIEFKGKKVIAGGVALDDVDLGLTLAGGRLEVKPLSVGISGGRLVGGATVDGQGPTPALNVNLEAKQVDYGQFLKQFKLSDIASGKLDASIALKGQGKSVAAVMAGLDGRARLVTQGGRIESGLVNVLSADVASALPFVKSEGDKDIRCGVVDFDVKKGRAAARTLVFETGGLSMIGTGTVNLADETLALNVDPRAKKLSVLKLTLVPVNVGGTLAQPTVLPDVGAAAVGAVTGAVKTAKDIAQGGVSTLGGLVGLGDKKAEASVDDTDYCKLALAGGPVERAKPAAAAPAARPSQQAPAQPPAQKREGTADKIDKTLDDLGKGVGGALKGLFGK